LPSTSGQATRLQKPDKEATDTSTPAPKDAGETVAPPPDSELAVKVRAKVNGVAILDEELRNATHGALMQARDIPDPEQRQARRAAILQQALDQLIEREVILHDALEHMKGEAGQRIMEKLKASAGKEFDKEVREMKKRAKCQSDEDFKQILLLQGASLEGMRRQFERTWIATEYMRFKVSGVIERIGLGDVYEYFRQHPDQFQVQDSVQYQDLFVAANKHGGLLGARTFAQSILARARAGEDFGQLVKQFDEGVGQFNTSAEAPKRHGEVDPPEIEVHLFNLKDGILGPLVELESGVHVFRLVKREYAGTMPFDAKTQKFIMQKLKNEAGKREWNRVLKEMKEKAVIEVCQ
jgi:hypothetical protein